MRCRVSRCNGLGLVRLFGCGSQLAQLALCQQPSLRLEACMSESLKKLGHQAVHLSRNCLLSERCLCICRTKQESRTHGPSRPREWLGEGLHVKQDTGHEPTWRKEGRAGASQRLSTGAEALPRRSLQTTSQGHLACSCLVPSHDSDPNSSPVPPSK